MTFTGAPLLAVLSAVAGGSTPTMVRAAASHTSLPYCAAIRAVFALVFVLPYAGCSSDSVGRLWWDAGSQCSGRFPQHVCRLASASVTHPQIICPCGRPVGQHGPVLGRRTRCPDA